MAKKSRWSRTRRTKQKSSKARNRERSAQNTADEHPLLIEYMAIGSISVLALIHLASVIDEFRAVAGLYRWLITYAEGFHRRGLVGTIFQYFVGDWPRQEQIALASQISADATYLWLVAGIALFWYATRKIGDRGLGKAALAFAAFAFINPMWTTRIHDNGYLDWLAGLCVVVATAAFAVRRPLLSGAVVAVGIVAYWGTVFVWLPLGSLIVLLLAYQGVCGRRPGGRLHRVLASGTRREALAIYLPLAAAVLSALFNDNAAAIAELERIGGQENIIREVFSGIGPSVAGQLEQLVVAWKTYIMAALVFAVPPAICAGLLVCMLRYRGVHLFGPAYLDVGAVVVATLSPLSFLLVAFDLTRLMGWTYLGFFVVAVFYLTQAKPTEDAVSRSGVLYPWMVVPLALAAFFWTTPTIYGWADMTYLISCKQFCFKEQTPQGRLLDAFRRQGMASPIWEYAAPGGLLPGATGHNENALRVARSGRDAAGAVMDLNIVLNDKTEGVTVRAPAQTQRAIIGDGPHRISISYRVSETAEANAATRFYLYDSKLRTVHEVIRVLLPPSQTEHVTTFTAPPDLVGNMFRWVILYNGNGTFELQEVSFKKVEEK